MGFGLKLPDRRQGCCNGRILSSGRNATRAEAPLLRCQAGVSTRPELTPESDDEERARTVSRGACRSPFAQRADVTVTTWVMLAWDDVRAPAVVMVVSSWRSHWTSKRWPA